jgi:hypothetical protein
MATPPLIICTYRGDEEGVTSAASAVIETLLDDGVNVYRELAWEEVEEEEEESGSATTNTSIQQWILEK